MGLCDYCGERAGWLQASHPACVAKANSMGETVKELVFKGILSGKPYTDLATEVQQALADNKVQSKYIQEPLLQAINDAISQIALQSPVSDDDFERLFAISEGFDVTPVNRRAKYAERRWFGVPQLALSHTLWQVLNHTAPLFDEALMFNLRSGEAPIFQTGTASVMYAEERTISTHTRSFGGLSLPVGGGVYYHIGGSQGHQERTSGLQELDIGGMLITSLALYFGGQKTTLRIPLDRVLRYQPYVDGVGVCESHGAPKVFVLNYGGMDMGWFLYNLLSALTNNLIQKASPTSTSQTRPSQPQIVKHERGIVKWFNAGKGFGFITGQNGEDIFVHFSAITEFGYRVLEEGEQVEYIVVKGPHGSQAENVRKVVG